MTLVSAVLPGCEMSDNTTSSQRGWAQSLLITGIQELWSFGECSALIYGHFLASESAWRALCAGGYGENPCPFPTSSLLFKKNKNNQTTKKQLFAGCSLNRAFKVENGPREDPRPSLPSVCPSHRTPVSPSFLGTHTPRTSTAGCWSH